MPGRLYEQEAMWVDDADGLLNYDDDDLIVEEEGGGDADFDLSDLLEGLDSEEEDLMISEEDAMPEGASFLVEEDDRRIPGSDKDEEDEEEAEEEEKTWKDHGAHAQFTMYLKDKITKIPRHSGETVPGCERAKAFLKSLDSEISKAMRSDLEGVVDESEIDGLRKNISDMMERLDRQIKKLSGSKKASLNVRLVSEGHCNDCESESPMWHDTANDKLVCMHCNAEALRQSDNIEKKAGTPILNVYISAFERAIVGTMVNSKVSAGKNIEETYDKLKNKYNFTPREELAIQQLVADYGYPVYKDRGLLNEPSDPATGDGVDWQTNYHA